MPVLIAEDDTIIAGHGRFLAAQQLGIATVPVMVARGWSDEQRRAYTIADNQLALNSEWNPELLRLELEELGNTGEFLNVLGFSEDSLAKALSGAPEPEQYRPVLEPTRDNALVTDDGVAKTAGELDGDDTDDDDRLPEQLNPSTARKRS